MPWDIVGVIRDVKTGSLADADRDAGGLRATGRVPCRRCSWPFARRPAVHRGSRPLCASLRSVDPELPLGGVLTMDERRGGSVRRERFRT
jgi:hypothetical protein